MKNIIATWICIDEKVNATHFPSAKGNSADARVQDVYWRCVCCFYSAARYHNPAATLVLFGNQAHLPEVDGVSVKEVLDQLNVEFFVTPFEYITPPGYYGAWRNQFYEFSIFKYVSKNDFFSDDDLFLLLDSDCVVTANLDLLFNEVQRKQAITYQIDYDAAQKINGISRKDMRFIFQELCQCNLCEDPVYHGGEFYASTVAFVKKIMLSFYIVWPQLLNRHLLGVQKLNEEAHVLSYLFFRHQVQPGGANGFIKRLWTDPSTYRNVAINDANLLIWHLPAAKTTGFKVFFRWLQSVNFQLPAVSPERFQRRIQYIFMVPVIPMQQKPYYVTRTFIKKYFSKIKAAI